MKNETTSRKFEKEEEIFITEMLKEVGMPCHLNGYYYMIEAIKIVYEDREYLKNITKGLYPEIARRHNTTASRVERTIRNSIEVAFIRGDPQELNQIFGNTISKKKGKPTNSEFIAMLYEHFRLYKV